MLRLVLRENNHRKKKRNVNSGVIADILQAWVSIYKYSFYISRKLKKLFYLFINVHTSVQWFPLTKEQCNSFDYINHK